MSRKNGYLVFGLILGTFLFFFNKQLSYYFAPNIYQWYQEFSFNIFNSHTIYFAESILLPLLAKIIGASKSNVTYKLFCSFFQVGIVIVVCIRAEKIFKNNRSVLLFILLFATTFLYLRNYQLGFPDPLTILLLIIVATTENKWLSASAIFLACLSHFSLTIISAIAYSCMIFLDNGYSFITRVKAVRHIFIGVIFGKLFLLLWYFVWKYNLTTRFQEAIWGDSYGIYFFWDQFKNKGIAFWLTPGYPFLFVYMFISIYFLYKKRYLFFIGQVFSLFLAYLALFFTIDGLRIFSVAMALPYVYLLKVFIKEVDSFLDKKIVADERFYVVKKIVCEGNIMYWKRKANI